MFVFGYLCKHTRFGTLFQSGTLGVLLWINTFDRRGQLGLLYARKNKNDKNKYRGTFTIFRSRAPSISVNWDFIWVDFHMKSPVCIGEFHMEGE